ncbi:hypothetical protein [Priestia aryabhattai]|uniref:hypothetical protein n=1 Tax=Priestia aryabhattai TaxID=412384 RepID=UPI001CFC10D4|nr:hypothetical protein [Priestia aryabhattai]
MGVFVEAIPKGLSFGRCGQRPRFGPPLEKGAGGIVMQSITKLNWVPIVELALFRLFGVLWKHTAGILHQVHHAQ